MKQSSNRLIQRPYYQLYLPNNAATHEKFNCCTFIFLRQSILSTMHHIWYDLKYVISNHNEKLFDSQYLRFENIKYRHK